MGIFDKREIKEVFEYPLFEAIIRRRSRRFPMGCALLEEVALPHVLSHLPVPLTDTETAILCYSAAGITGAITLN
jgi:hypothetical protein